MVGCIGWRDGAPVAATRRCVFQAGALALRNRWLCKAPRCQLAFAGRKSRTQLAQWRCRARRLYTYRTVKCPQCRVCAASRTFVLRKSPPTAGLF
ncbi:jg7754 [Pararge aegeria aegeria]|uniref:Jg7754 protein n=1 Tax=Pararge aegeria aegeria TaxID=348720 RepID=A0A8S4S4C3_9NEOP|nr:jg7754 [Pararge aegeria aegeria]